MNHTYGIDPKKNMVLLAFILLFWALFGVFIWIYIPQLSLRIALTFLSAIVFCFCMKRTLQDFHTTLEYSDYYLKSYRYGQTIVVDWKTVRRIEYSNKIFLKVFDVMIIHSDNNNDIYVDYNYMGYKTLWCEIINRAETNPEIIIDKEFYRLLKK